MFDHYYSIENLRTYVCSLFSMFFICFLDGPVARITFSWLMLFFTSGFEVVTGGHGPH